MPVQFSGFYPINARWENGQPLTKTEKKEILPKMGKWEDHQAFILRDGTAILAVNDEKGNGYRQYWELYNEASRFDPRTMATLDPGGIKDWINAFDKHVIRPLFMPRYYQKLRAVEKQFRQLLQGSPTVNVTVKNNPSAKGEWARHEFVRP